jgi:hypothetical protein
VDGHIVAYSLETRIVESQQQAVTRHQPIQNNREIAFSEHVMPMAAHASMEYIMLLIRYNCLAT